MQFVIGAFEGWCLQADGRDAPFVDPSEWDKRLRKDFSVTTSTRYCYTCTCSRGCLSTSVLLSEDNVLKLGIRRQGARASELCIGLRNTSAWLLLRAMIEKHCSRRCFDESASDSIAIFRADLRCRSLCGKFSLWRPQQAQAG
jgi:hypothetical protein